MKTRWMLALAILGLLSLSRASTGAPVVKFGTMHAYANAFNNPGSATDNPPEKTLIPPSTSIDADAVAYGLYLDGYSEGRAHSTVSQGADGVIGIDAATSITSRSSFGDYFAEANTSGLLSFTETTAQALAWSFDSDGSFGLGSIAVQDSSSTTILGLFSQFPPTTLQGTLALTPGDYTIQWQLAAQTTSGGGGPSFMQFTLVPEPRSLAIPLVGALFAIVTTRTTRCPKIRPLRRAEG